MFTNSKSTDSTKTCLKCNKKIKILKYCNLKVKKRKGLLIAHFCVYPSRDVLSYSYFQMVLVLGGESTSLTHLYSSPPPFIMSRHDYSPEVFCRRLEEKEKSSDFTFPKTITGDGSQIILQQSLKKKP